MLTKVASADELETELRKLLAYAATPNPSRLVLAHGLSTLSERVSGHRTALQRMDTEDLIKAFDSLRPKQKVKVTMKAVMSMSPSETGTPTEYIVGRRGKGRYGETVSLLPADGSKPHPMRKVTLYKRENHEGNTYVSVGIGDMGATLIAIDPV
jgi:hypothetical protein